MSQSSNYNDKIPSSLKGSGVRFKVCGMKYKDNINEIAALQPDYMGFIFYGKSIRSFENDIPELPQSIKKVGVFVNAHLEEIVDKVKKHNLQMIQLHGEESPEFCHAINNRLELFSRSNPIEVIKVFSIKDAFDFSLLQPYEGVCHYYLFDTKGENPGGNGYAFDWTVLKKYPSTKPYFLSGGIGLRELSKISLFLKNSGSKYCYAIDVNSKFEMEPGLKDVDKVKEFKNKLKHG